MGHIFLNPEKPLPLLHPTPYPHLANSIQLKSPVYISGNFQYQTDQQLPKFRKEEDNHARCTQLYKSFFPEVFFPFIPFRLPNRSPFQFSRLLGTFVGNFRTICHPCSVEKRKEIGNTGSVAGHTGKPIWTFGASMCERRLKWRAMGNTRGGEQ